ncbi:hypothetical protein GCM10012320_05030 [Sinomonas cellulolyticus]|uniref:VOC family protein n=1 Tax=Sinomonas cellulolyticus TaxID=2801916 RepID=A0ABS1K2V7_9MICC|nr:MULTISPECIES: VOC family protein [Sinomonas]MBL0705833.1 VOC family protein [Sinomonas cellulolyticus]GHG42253.1 hypothetical protein GCM10012320_05030 [Sinomonas sp. KCTC 49339]
MPKPDLTPGAPCWTDLMTSNVERAKDFYAALFGWTYEVGDEEKYGGYVTASKDGAPVAGLMAPMEGQSSGPDAWTVYLKSDDLDETAAKVQSSGGQTLVAPMDVPDEGRMAVFTDAGGAAFGVWQSLGHTGFEKMAEPGAPAWFEVHTRAFGPALAFYQEALGWETETMSDTPEFRYATLGSGRDQRAGIYDASADLPEGVPSHWIVYWDVESTDNTVETATRLGATVLIPPVDTPYGRMAALTDPTGALFRLMQHREA